MAKKKAPSGKATKLKNNTKKIIAIQHREIKHTGRKFDNAFLEMKIWLPLWELPLWIFPPEENQSQSELAKQLKLALKQIIGE
jgi:hypothetical protein